MNHTFHFHEIARLPMPNDNVAIATRRLDAGTNISLDGQRFTLDYTILEGHRFAVQPIRVGEPLLSWGLPFGVAIRDINAGAVVRNDGMLNALQGRSIDFELPTAANFADQIHTYKLDQNRLYAAEQVSLYDDIGGPNSSFMGYRRTPPRGVGTRNFIILLGTTSRTAGFVRQLEARLGGVADQYENIDGIVAIAHTEGGHERPNNLELLLRTLAGFMVHPNVGAVLAVDYASKTVTNEMLRHYMIENDYPLHEVTHRFFSLRGPFQANLAQGAAIVNGWLDEVNRTARSEEPLSHLKIALQCGGSDAFSGVSGNPLASWVAREVIRHGGAANLAETDELLGAESYVLQKVKDLNTARQFLSVVERFKERVSWHGTTAEGNPSGGNKFRGLYNIVLKSIGAAMKRHPDVRLDYVIEYGELMAQPGYYFMDSPGNDLESIAGQVAAGCNMIFFVTGNGSITNFPFVPTIKIVTTSKRYELLAQDMDVNAGAYLDGTPMDELGQQMFDLTLNVASGKRSVGEKAGHAQVQIWRDWPQKDGRQLEQLLKRALPNGASLPIKADAPVPDIHFQAIRTNEGYTTDQIGLILPTSLCSGQIARMAANHLNQKVGGPRPKKISRFVSLVHTEGCGASSGPSEELYMRTLIGYLTNPLVKHCLLLEHGCEKTHNDYMRHHMRQMGLDPQQFGWASVQLDGGITNVIQKIEAWFTTQIAETPAPTYHTVGLDALRIGLISTGPVSPNAAQQLAQLTKTIAAAGGTVIVPQNASLLTSTTYLTHIGRLPSGRKIPVCSEENGRTSIPACSASLAYAQRVSQRGFHIMETPSGHWVETLTGLGATGVEIVLAYVGNYPRQSHPLLPVLQVSAEKKLQTGYGADIDLLLEGDSAQWTDNILRLIVDTVSQNYRPKLYQQGNIGFQITRGLLGISM